MHGVEGSQRHKVKQINKLLPDGFDMKGLVTKLEVRLSGLEPVVS